ncbi:hypothetical protein GARC_2740 [Paraglaciecola arctica BSs20135]|uniref:Uncharacterized protein n=1 Tax=Paraglaciecola arctica BSs20135 TaxID=493475 RepID=K6Z8C5_9ALTE|nr:hypothetical protein GARC_2740 [Paraglaciecola arctica BSs20135]
MVVFSDVFFVLCDMFHLFLVMPLLAICFLCTYAQRGTAYP